MPRHPLIDQLLFTRAEFIRAIRGVSAEDAQERLLPMNCLSWNVGHLAWQEQKYFLDYAESIVLFPDIAKEFAFGAPASTPSLEKVLTAWKTITKATNPWLDRLTSAVSMNVGSDGPPFLGGFRADWWDDTTIESASAFRR